MAFVTGTGFQLAAKNSRVSAGGANLANARWQVQFQAEDLPTENFTSIGKNEGILGFIGLTWTTSGDWDANTPPYSLVAPPGFFPRDDLRLLAFYESYAGTQALSYNFPYARVRSSTNGAEVKGKVTFEASGMSQGDAFLPGGLLLSVIQFANL